MGIQNYSTTPSANILINGISIAEGCAPSGINDAIRQLMADVAAGTVVQQAPTSTGSANAYVVALSPVPAAYSVGMVVRFVASFANTAAATVNVNALGAKNIYKITPTNIAALSGGEIQIGQFVEAVYDGTQFQVVSPLAVDYTAVKGISSNLRGTWVSATVATWTASQLLLQNAAGLPYLAKNLSASINTALTGVVNGLDTGTLAASTWYNVFAIYNGTTLGVLFSLSATSPTLPTGYSYFTRIGAIFLDPSKNIISFTQAGSYAQWLSPKIIGSGSTSGAWVGANWSQTAPPTAIKLRLCLQGINQYAGAVCAAAPSTSYTFGALGNAPMMVMTTDPTYPIFVNITAEMQTEAVVVYFGSTNAYGCQLYVLGYEDLF